MFARPPILMLHDPEPRSPLPDPPDGLLDQALDALADTPWWGWLILAGIGLVVATIVVVLVIKVVMKVAAAVGGALSGSVSGVRSWVATTAATNRDQLTARARVWGEMLSSWLVTAQFLIAMGFAAWSMSKTARDVLGVPEPANWLLFAVFEGFALVVMALIKQRVDQGLPYPGLLAGYWATIGLASLFVSTNGTGVVDSCAYACITLIAGATYALRMSFKRKDVEEELRAAGERRKNRRMALVRWLHPWESVQVQLALAADENLSADEATEKVREERARDALWDLGQAKAEPFPRTGWGQRLALRREHRLERRAQKRIARAGVAGNPQVVARLSAEMQMMQMASTMATSDHTPEQVQEWAQNLVTEGMWGGQVELEAADPDRIGPVVPELEFTSALFEEGEVEPARLDPAGRLEPDPVVAEFTDRTDPWEEPGPVQTEEVSGSDRFAPVAEEVEESEPDRVEPTESDQPEPDRIEPTEPDPSEEIGPGRVEPMADRSEPEPESDRTAQVEPEAEPTEASRIDGRTEAQPEPTTEPVRTEPATEPNRPHNGLRPGMTVETGSGRLRVKALKPQSEADRSIRAVDGRTGAHRTFAELQADMEQAIRDGHITDNVVEHLVRVLKIGKVRGRKLRDWAKDTHLFERIRDEQHGASSPGGTLEEDAPTLPSTSPTPGVRP